MKPATVALVLIVAAGGCEPAIRGTPAASTWHEESAQPPPASQPAKETAAPPPATQPALVKPAEVAKGGFFGLKLQADHIVYLLDRSGSMLDTLDLVRHEVFKSITRLRADQTFHVIFFATGRPMENPPRRLVYATEDHKREAGKYLKTVYAQGRTDPLPAVQRAFQVLARTPNRKRGKAICLLTDGEFPDNELVLKTIRKLNARREVTVHTVLHHFKSPAAVAVLRRIAADSGGKFKYVPPEE